MALERDGAPGVATIDAVVDNPQGNMPLRHVLEIVEHGERFEVVDERIENEQPLPWRKRPFYFLPIREGQSGNP